ncbi:hypothetical protein HYV86_07780 [Candidatus Woesearchaeota archaeon]|nr:hypothetical protein [Candidatus Woesearchaeota archaeon]
MNYSLPTALLFTTTATVTLNTASAQTYEPKQPYHFMAVLGADTPLNGEGTFTPVVRLNYYTELEQSPWDLLIQADSLSGFAQFHHRGVIGTGLDVRMNYISWGNYRDYEHGSRKKEEESTAHEAGMTTFVTLTTGLFDARASVFGAYKMYDETSDTSRELPSNHLLVRPQLDLKFREMDADLIFGTRQGFELRLLVEEEFRPGYRSHSPELSDYQHTVGSLFHAQLGTGQRLNLTGDVRLGGEWHADEYNAWRGGSFVSPQIPFPGTNLNEVRTPLFLDARAAASILLHPHYRVGAGVWGLTTQRPAVEGAAALEMPVQLGLEINLRAKVGGIVPLGINAGYAPWMERNGKEGAWNLLGFVALGFDKIEAAGK